MNRRDNKYGWLIGLTQFGLYAAVLFVIFMACSHKIQPPPAAPADRTVDSQSSDSDEQEAADAFHDEIASPTCKKAHRLTEANLEQRGNTQVLALSCGEKHE